jgi:hypothetical protein
VRVIAPTIREESGAPPDDTGPRENKPA